jgi:HK97 family phage major capsid protein
MTDTQEKEFANVIEGLKGVPSRIDDLAKSIELIKETPEQLKRTEQTVQKLQEQMDTYRKAQLSQKSNSRKRKGEVSEECARHFGAMLLLNGVKQDKLEGISKSRAADMFKEITGVEMKTALTSSDIPLPIVYSGDVVELVGDFSAARQYATVFPLGGSSVKLPKLGTDTTFGLIAGSGTVTEKSPTVPNVTFNAEKFGGLIRLPSELDEDSIVPLGQFLARYAARQLAYVEDYQVFRSSGAGSGLNGTAEGLTKSVVTDSKTTVSGVLGSPSEFTLTHFRTLRTVCDAAALRMGAYYMHPSFEQKLASFNSSGDKPYQANGLGGATLDGFPIRWVDVMPVYSSSDVLSTVHALFGDVSFQYLGIRGGIRFDTSMEAAFTTDEILVRALERLTTGKMATGAVAGLITYSA